MWPKLTTALITALLSTTAAALPPTNGNGAGPGFPNYTVGITSATPTCESLYQYDRCNSSLQPIWHPQTGFWWNPAAPWTTWSIQQSSLNGHTIMFNVIGFDQFGNRDWFTTELEPVGNDAAPNVYVASQVFYCSGGQPLTSPNYQPANCQLVPMAINVTFTSQGTATAIINTRTDTIVPFAF